MSVWLGLSGWARLGLTQLPGQAGRGKRREGSGWGSSDDLVIKTEEAGHDILSSAGHETREMRDNQGERRERWDSLTQWG